jgi:phosphomannomutase
MSTLFAKQVFGDGPWYIFDDMDGRFPNHEPNPLIPKNVEPLRNLVKEKGADVGVIYDGDADRVMFVDELGRFVPPDLVVAMMALYFCDCKGNKNPRVLQEIRSSKSVGEYLAKYGAELHTWRVGRAYAAPKLREIDGLWGGELAGHYYFKDFYYSDSGLLSSMIVLNIVNLLKSQGKTLGGEIDRIKNYQNSGEINFRLEDKAGAIAAVSEMFASFEKPLAKMDFDGVRMEFDKWWFNIRPSNTEPYLRFICEAVNDELLKEKVSMAENLLKKEFGAVRE